MLSQIGFSSQCIADAERVRRTADGNLSSLDVGTFVDRLWLRTAASRHH
jgi:hypothetical protein